ncbi:RHS repeat-associated core domain-containing protein [Salinispora oceanensis]|uniref:RHS repeat-associated core domain-containing protein n=1 Tax=Salinispora oceanensis TaxID=1050199 RepID=UPI000380EEB4|nr:RHS repeat-associated core domain-containing protein [Salinispora oceanensis]
MPAPATGGEFQGFTGREYDTDTGLLHNRARDYSPGLGRFISEDPAGFGGASTNLCLSP